MQYTGGQENNTMYIILGVIVIVLLLGLFMMWPTSSPVTQPVVIIPGEQPTTYVAPPTAPPVLDYSFYPYMDSGGNDIMNAKGLANKVAELKAQCDALANCVGFNTNAWLKNTIRPQSQWYKWTDDATKGLYIKPGVSY